MKKAKIKPFLLNEAEYLDCVLTLWEMQKMSSI